MFTDKIGLKSDKLYFFELAQKNKGYYFFNYIENKVSVSRSGGFLGKNLSKNNRGSNVQFKGIRELV